MAGGDASQAFVEPSRSVKTKVRVPSGSPPMGMTVLHAECYLLSVPLKVPKDVEELAKEVERGARVRRQLSRGRSACDGHPGHGASPAGRAGSPIRYRRWWC